jgi:flavin reductase (DIM6/NTAB) family NADH-FMN oxidoreductase RutF
LQAEPAGSRSADAGGHRDARRVRDQRPGAPQEELSANFDRRGLAADWAAVPHRPGLTGSPRLHGMLATLECTVEHRLPAGDHEIIVGRARDVEIGNGEAAPLLLARPVRLPRRCGRHQRPP